MQRVSLYGDSIQFQCPANFHKLSSIDSFYSLPVGMSSIGPYLNTLSVKNRVVYVNKDDSIAFCFSSNLEQEKESTDTFLTLLKKGFEKDNKRHDDCTAKPKMLRSQLITINNIKFFKWATMQQSENTYYKTENDERVPYTTRWSVYNYVLFTVFNKSPLNFAYANLKIIDPKKMEDEADLIGHSIVIKR